MCLPGFVFYVLPLGRPVHACFMRVSLFRYK